MPRSTPGAKATRDSKPSSFVGRTRKRMRCDQKPLKMGNAITKSACEEESSSQNKAQSQILSHFSDDILSRILFSGYLDTSPRDLSNRMRVCKRFQSVAKHSVTVIDAHRGDRFNEPTSQMFFNIIGQFPHLQEVDFSFCRNFNDAHLDCLSSLRAQLRVLRLKGTSVTDDGVMSFFEYDKRTVSCMSNGFSPDFSIHFIFLKIIILICVTSHKISMFRNPIKIKPKPSRMILYRNVLAAVSLCLTRHWKFST